jgi:hypothetical protein
LSPLSVGTIKVAQQIGLHAGTLSPVPLFRPNAPPVRGVVTAPLPKMASAPIVRREALVGASEFFCRLAMARPVDHTPSPQRQQRRDGLTRAPHRRVSDPTRRKVLVAVDASATLFGAPVATVAQTPDDDAICWWDRAEMEAWALRSPDALNRIEFGPIGWQWAMLPICICHPTNSVVPQVSVDQAMA